MCLPGDCCEFCAEMVLDGENSFVVFNLSLCFGDKWLETGVGGLELVF